jgi:S-adenosylmethionine synthetase
MGDGSSDLIEVFKGNTEVPMANDTSFGVAHAPLSEIESIALNAENKVMADLRNKEKAIGEDMKVMALREKDKISLTIGDAFISKYVDDYEHYKDTRRRLKEYINGVAEAYTSREVNTMINMADSPDSVYITVSGTSAEMGDDGAEGRGNRSNGLITLNRPMSMEGTPEVYIKILSEIGRGIDDPKVANAQIVPKSDVNLGAIEKKVERITDEWLANITEITEMVIREELKTF